MNKHTLATCRAVIDALTDTEPQPPGGPTNHTAWRSSVAERLRREHWNTIRTLAETDPERHPASITAELARTLGAPNTDPYAGQQAAFNARCQADAQALANRAPGVPMPERVRHALHRGTP